MITLATKHQRLTALRPLSPESVASFAAAWNVRMVYESNSIEGSSLTLRETAMVLANPMGVNASGWPLKDYEDALDLAKACQTTRELAVPGAELTEPILLEIYRAFRGCKRHTFIGGSLSNGTQAIAQVNGADMNSFRVPEYLGEIFMGLYDIESPVEQAAFIHNQVRKSLRFDEHPGLIARLAMNFVLLAAGYPPVSIPTDLRQAYYAALEAADAGDFPAWSDFLTRQLDHELDLWLDALEETEDRFAARQKTEDQNSPSPLSNNQ